MDNLMDGIIRFKKTRQMAKMPVKEQDRLAGLIKMYETIQSGSKHLKPAFAERWEWLPKAERAELVNRLLSRGLLSATIKYALDIFDGEIVSLF